MNPKTIAFVPVRGGSKSIPLKNIKMLCGRPLVYWTLEALRRTPAIDEIVVATDSDRIAETVAAFGFGKVSVYRRKTENASDTASTESVMLEYIEAEKLSGDVTFLLVQATSPLTDRPHFEEGLAIFRSGRFDSVLSCVRNKRFFWREDGTSINYDFRRRPRRQDFRGVLMENGAFYVSSAGAIRESGNRLSGRIGICEMPEWTAVEIDEPEDWPIVENLMLRHRIPGGQTSFAGVRLVATDVDGVLTDAGMYYSESGDELKKFNTRDGMGFRLLREAGLQTAVLTSERTEIVSRRAAKLSVDHVCQGVFGKDKLEALRAVCERTGVDLSETAYIGDDVNCIPLLEAVGFPVCPADAENAVKSVPGIHVLGSRGGKGAFRELANAILGR